MRNKSVDNYQNWKVKNTDAVKKNIIMKKFLFCHNLCILICSFLFSKSVTALTCPTGCECRYYPRRPIVCTLNPGLQTFPNDIPALTLALSVSGTNTVHNHFRHLVRHNFDNISSLKHLTLAFCEIVTMDDGIFAPLTGLQTLHLQHNQIQRISSATLAGPTKLQVLDLTGNRNCILEPSAFASVPSLEELYLGEMEISTIDTKIFSGLTSLSKLDLHGNNIKIIDPSHIQALSDLVFLDLSENSIQTMPNETGPILSNLHTLHLGGNPWHCNCELLWLRTLPIKHIYDPYNNGQTIICSSPEKHKYRSFVDIDASDFHCTPPKIVSCDKNTISVHVSLPVTVSCVLEGDPFPDVTWTRKNGDKFQYDSQNTGLVSVLENGTLKISQTSALDDGTWTLKVSDSYGKQERQIQIHVILPTTTTATTTTTKTTTKRPPSTSKPINIATKQTTGKKVTAGPTQTTPRPIHSKTTPATATTTQTKDKAKDDNTLLLVAGGAGGAVFLALCGAIAYCIKRKNNQSKVRDVRPDDDFDSVRSPRRSTRNTSKTTSKTRPIHRTHSYLDF